MHPYYPLSLELPGYVPNNSELSTNAIQFCLLWGLVLGSSWLLLLRKADRLAVSDKLACLWFILCTWWEMKQGIMMANGIRRNPTCLLWRLLRPESIISIIAARPFRTVMEGIRIVWFEISDRWCTCTWSRSDNSSILGTLVICGCNMYTALEFLEASYPSHCVFSTYLRWCLVHFNQSHWYVRRRCLT